MHKIAREIISFFQAQGAVIVSTIDAHGFPHSSCKGIIEIKEDGFVYLLDLYHGQTSRFLKANSHIALTAVDEHKFKGYCLKGVARMVTDTILAEELLEAWDVHITSRITQRLLRNIRGDKGHTGHPEILLPNPKYLIEIEIQEIVDLTPHHIV